MRRRLACLVAWLRSSTCLVRVSQGARACASPSLTDTHMPSRSRPLELALKHALYLPSLHPPTRTNCTYQLQRRVKSERLQRKVTGHALLTEVAQRRGYQSVLHLGNMVCQEQPCVKACNDTHSALLQPSPSTQRISGSCYRYRGARVPALQRIRQVRQPNTQVQPPRCHSYANNRHPVSTRVHTKRILIHS